MRQISLAKRSTASRSAAPSEEYWSRSSMESLFHHRDTGAAEKTDLIDSIPTARDGWCAKELFCSIPCDARGESRILQPGLNPLGQGSEIGDPLQFVVWKLDVEVLFQASEQAERLQAVDAQLLEEIVGRRQACPRHFELLSRQVQDFIFRLLLGSHG